ncbi:maleylpyruvate isomerase family mycothiol-dependent enzyme [Rhodococcus aetherivorans]|uniref:maleylpyruvate isomerase family mycothiol-dependent enzyme n=1 Tax=Rhodococcus aetherivorans TaxID=191292 RepID=UPI00389099D0
MDRASYPALLRADTERLLAAGEGRLDRPVPTCPRWSVERLLGHVGRVHRNAAGWLRTGGRTEIPPAPAGAAVVAWVRDGLEELTEAVQSADPHVDEQTFAGPQPASFWVRRMAVETALHRIDAELAAGEGTTPVDTTLAVEGIDELFGVLLPFRALGGAGALGEAGSAGWPAGSGKTMHLHATDPALAAGEGEWLITFDADEPSVVHTHAEGDVAVRGPASDLLLLLWNRASLDRFDVFGDAALLTRWRDEVTI